MRPFGDFFSPHALLVAFRWAVATTGSFGDFFSLHALLAVFGWAAATGMAISHLWHPASNKLVTKGLIVVCMLGAAATWVEGAREHSENRSIRAGIEKNIQKTRSNVNNNPDEVLSGASEKLMQQDNEIKTLQNQVKIIEQNQTKSITHPENGLYIGSEMIAQSAGQPSQLGNELIFQLLISGEKKLDFNQTYEFQNKKIRCSRPGVFGSQGSSGVLSYRYVNVRCIIQ